MPSTNGLATLIRNTSLTREEWFELIELRRDTIRPYLDSMTLPELGDLKCLHSEGFERELRFSAATITGDKLLASLKTQGIFFSPPSAVERIPNSGFRPEPGGCTTPNGTRWVWGLTRRGLWVLVTVTFVGEPGYKDRGSERATEINVVQSNLPAIAAKVKEEPQRMWERLGEFIKRVAAHRKALSDHAAELARMVEFEEMAFRHVPK